MLMNVDIVYVLRVMVFYSQSSGLCFLNILNASMGN